PETRNPNARKLDFAGLSISVIGLVLLVYGIIHASETKDWLALAVLLPIIGGLLVIALFLVLEARSDHSSFDVSLFRNRGYAVSLVAVSLSFFALSGLTFSLPFYLQILRGYSTLVAGLCFVPFAVGQLLAAPRSAKMVLRFGYRKVMTTGLVLVTIALIGLSQLQLDSPLWFLLTVFFVFGFGMGNVIAPGSTVMQNVLPLARVGAGSAVQNTVRQVFGALGVAIIGTILATQYASNVAPVLDTLPPAFPDAGKEAASESIIATVAVLGQASAEGLPASTVASVQAGAFDAFLSATHVTSIISLVVVGIAAIIVGFFLPHISPPTAAMERGLGPKPVDPADELIHDETESYGREVDAEYVEKPGPADA
ncbi:MAG: MFS transporter, partial [Actinobacteria bacterium]|nr:MFS transporter [Actinomycetota bacterium]